MATVGDRIRKARKARNLSQPELALRAKVSKGSISQWETNMNTPKSQNLHNLAEALGVTPEYILTGAQAAESHDPAIEEAEQIMRELQQKDRSHALQILRAFLQSRQDE